VKAVQIILFLAEITYTSINLTFYFVNNYKTDFPDFPSAGQQKHNALMFFCLIVCRLLAARAEFLKKLNDIGEEALAYTILIMVTQQKTFHPEGERRLFPHSAKLRSLDTNLRH
jgi:hypothetical protein